ncbi:hypothetical protein KAU33_05315 [Candidatus Dependentiae bacterium]|nr:hypothetical protein [Candidatus Dependentiae bacterium]
MKNIEDKLLKDIYSFTFKKNGSDSESVGLGQVFQDILNLNKPSGSDQTHQVIFNNYHEFISELENRKKEIDIIFFQNPLSFLNLNEFVNFIKENISIVKSTGAIIVLSNAFEDEIIDDDSFIPIRLVRKELVEFDIIVKRKRASGKQWMIKFIKKRISKTKNENLKFSIPLEFFNHTFNKHYPEYFVKIPNSFTQYLNLKTTLLLFPRPGNENWIKQLNLNNPDIVLFNKTNFKITENLIEDNLELNNLKKKYDLIILSPDFLLILNQNKIIKRLFSRIQELLKKNGVFIFNLNKLPEYYNIKKTMVLGSTLTVVEKYINHDRKIGYNFINVIDEGGKKSQVQKEAFYTHELLKSILENRNYKVVVEEEDSNNFWFVVK